MTVSDPLSSIVPPLFHHLPSTFTESFPLNCAGEPLPGMDSIVSPWRRDHIMPGAISDVQYMVSSILIHVYSICLQFYSISLHVYFTLIHF